MKNNTLNQLLLQEPEIPYMQVSVDALCREKYKSLFVDPSTGTPLMIEEYSQKNVRDILATPGESQIRMNCNQDVLLILQAGIFPLFSWSRFMQDDFPRLSQQSMYPVAINNSETGIPLFLATVTRETIRMSLETGNLIMWSQSRNKLWIKGETSGDYLRLRDLFWDPGRQVFFAKVFPETGGVCHEKIDTNGNIDPNGIPASTCFRRLIGTE